jgi:hypothetical protein
MDARAANPESITGALTAMTARGWPLLICQPRSKAPLGELVPHGVKDATTNADVIARWWSRCPNANWAVAAGAPGPQVLDIDDPKAVPPAVATVVMKAPRTRSARGGAAFFEGTDASTVNLGWGELRGRGSYQMIPPSIHPNGTRYAWVLEPRGKLLAVPACVRADANPAWGKGRQPTVEQVPPGQMYDHLGDLATRLVLARITNADVIERVLLVEFQAVRVPGADYGHPADGRRDTRRIAEWAADSKLANPGNGHGRRALVLGDAGLQNLRPLQ